MLEEIFAKLAERRPDSHKYQYGHVLVVGGSPGMVGAPLLAATAALRTGAGLATIAAGPGVTDKLERRVAEVMTLALPAKGNEAAAKLETFVKNRKVSVVVAGPGLAVEPESGILIEKLIAGSKLPTIIDGGGLSALQNRLNLLDESPSEAIILTPHEGEFQRLINKPLPEKRPDLKPVASGFSKSHNVILVLKGHPTYIADPDGSVRENTTGNPGMATAGAGDVLSGVIAGMIAQGISPSAAAEAAVYLHGLAGDIAAASKTEPGMIASDVIESLPDALSRARQRG